VSKIFLDAQKEKIYAADAENPEGRRVPHTAAEGDGYQRDPWKRKQWLGVRVNEGWEEEKARTLSLSKRDDGFFACIDGGGRWFMAQKSDIETLPAVIFENMERTREAELFHEFDSETYKLRGIETFVALVSAKDPMALAILEAVAPYRIAQTGKGTLKCVGSMATVYMGFGDNYNQGLRVISKTAKILANTWSGFQGNGVWTQKKSIDGKFFTAIAAVIEAAESLDEAALRKVLQLHPPADIDQRIQRAIGPKPKTMDATIQAAKVIGRLYRTRVGRDSRYTINLSDIDNTGVIESLLENRTFSSRKREARREAAVRIHRRAAS